jgi:hypothetical protein
MPPQSRTRRLSSDGQATLRRLDDAELRRRDVQTEAILARLAPPSGADRAPSLRDLLLPRSSELAAPTDAQRAAHEARVRDTQADWGPVRRWTAQVAEYVPDFLGGALWGDPTVPGASRANLLGQMLTAGLPLTSGIKGGLGTARRGAVSAWKGQPQAPYVRTPEGALVVSTRVPTAKRPVAETGPPGPLVTGLEEVMRNPVGTAKKPSLAEKMATIVRPSPVLTEREAAMGTSDVLGRFVDSADENLRYLMRLMGPLGERSSEWYQGAHKIARDIANTWGMTADQGTGIISVLSPQKQWDMNVKLGQRVGEHAATFANADQPFSLEMYRQHVLLRRKSVAATIAENRKKGKITESQGKRVMAKENATLRAQRSLVGRPWSGLEFSDRAHMVRAYDELANPQTFNLYTPEGDVYDVARNVGGEPSALVWNSNAEITKAIGIASDPSPENISYWLGARHKVRSFFNNISAPEYGRRPGERGSSTIDTHEVAAGHMAPLGGKSGYVLRSMGTPGEAATGIQGTNPLYQTAVERSVRGTPYLPRQGQSITWEGIQGVFSPTQKSNKALQAEVGRIWSEYRGGHLSKDQTLDAVLNAAGGFQPPGWARTKAP